MFAGIPKARDAMDADDHRRFARISVLLKWYLNVVTEML